ncbi:MAG: twin-arginine translocase TatA/TatE family subunit [Candidatus Thermoplasmatota archaeon]|nr:twin-arginine translocase TatA/TatE family subunit [Candidatus Thermoplasmatota archaeon]
MAFDSPIDWIIIIAVVLVLFGSTKKIPEFARNIGRATGEFKRGQMELKNELAKAMNGTDNPVKKETDYNQIARDLGIDPENKSKDELLSEIKGKINSDN